MPAVYDQKQVNVREKKYPENHKSTQNLQRESASFVDNEALREKLVGLRQGIDRYNELKTKILKGVAALDPELMRPGAAIRSTVRAIRSHEAEKEELDNLHNQLVPEVLLIQGFFEDIAEAGVSPDTINQLVDYINDEKLRDNVHRIVQSTLTEMRRGEWQEALSKNGTEELSEAARITPEADVSLGKMIDGSSLNSVNPTQAEPTQKVDPSLMNGDVIAPPTALNRPIPAEPIASTVPVDDPIEQAIPAPTSENMHFGSVPDDKTTTNNGQPSPVADVPAPITFSDNTGIIESQAVEADMVKPKTPASEESTMSVDAALAANPTPLEKKPKEVDARVENTADGIGANTAINIDQVKAYHTAESAPSSVASYFSRLGPGAQVEPTEIAQ
ncbi:MAG TPA: hypothetical protein PK263_02920 [bacterium]|nr:hypothetical protein [bacterium]